MGRQRQLERDVRMLAETIGARNLRDEGRAENLAAAREYVATRFGELGMSVARERYQVGERDVEILITELRGSTRPNEIVIVGAHYDTHGRSPGANDNATGIAALLAIAESLRLAPRDRTLRFVAFPNEEHPFTRTHLMGSRVYAKRCRARGEHVVSMVSLETLGAHRRRPRVAVVSNLASRSLRLARRVHEALHPVDARRVIGPGFLPLLRSSDHWSFWKEGFAAVMVTDGGPVRYLQYHRRSDRTDVVDFEALAEVTSALANAVSAIARTSAA